MKVIFLDVDGVLNCLTTTETINGWVFVDDDKIKLVRYIMDKTGAVVVLSSTWRQGYYGINQKNPGDTSDWGIEEYEALKERCEKYGVRFFGYTAWPLSDDRERLIKDWMDEWNGEKIESFVILDDWPFFKDLADHFVWTKERVGLTKDDAYEAIRILGGKT